jgi:RNA polymerase sigma-70 factor (ECF subfamily)
VADGTRTFDAQTGRDPAALAAVYRANAGYVWRTLRHCGVPDSDLDDAVQETFLVVFRRLPEFEARAALRTWIYAVAVRVAATRRRSQRREAARRELAGHGMHGGGAADPEAELSKAEAADLVDRLLDELDASKRTVFVLAELEGVKVPEISRILGVNPRTVHSRLRLARESFGSALKRMQAHEQGNRRVARLRPRPLLEQAANDRPPAARRKAAMAALAARIEQGAIPGLAGWEGLALGSSWAGSLGPMTAMVGVLGAVVTAVVVAMGSPASDTRSTTNGSGDAGGRSHDVDATEQESSATPNRTRASTVDEPIVRLGSTIGDPSVPIARPRTAARNVDGTIGRSPSTKEHAGTPAMRTELMIGHADGSGTRPTTARDASGTGETRADAPTSPPTDDGAASTLAAETRLLERARDALRRGDADAALTALDAHSSDFPHGLLLDEARSTRLRALCAAGRADEADALADAWAPGRQGSRWHDVVAAACR